MAHPRKSREHDSTNGAVPGGCSDKDASDNPIDPRAFGLSKAAYGVGETLDLLSIGRTSLYEAIKRGGLKRVKFGKKTLLYASDLASFLTEMRRLSEADAHRVSHAPVHPKVPSEPEATIGPVMPAGPQCESAWPLTPQSAPKADPILRIISAATHSRFWLRTVGGVAMESASQSGW